MLAYLSIFPLFIINKLQDDTTVFQNFWLRQLFHNVEENISFIVYLKLKFRHGTAKKARHLLYYQRLAAVGY